MLILVPTFSYLWYCAQAVSGHGLAAELQEQLQPLVSAAANDFGSAVTVGVVVGNNVKYVRVLAKRVWSVLEYILKYIFKNTPNHFLMKTRVIQKSMLSLLKEI